MLDRAPAARVHCESPVQALSAEQGRLDVQTPGGRRGPYRYVVINAPPRTGRRLLRPLSASTTWSNCSMRTGTSSRAC